MGAPVAKRGGIMAPNKPAKKQKVPIFLTNYFVQN
jgi:hypothetical protein